MTDTFKLGTRVSYINGTSDFVPATSYLFVVSDGAMEDGNYRLAYAEGADVKTFVAPPNAIIYEEGPVVWERDDFAPPSSVGYYQDEKSVVIGFDDREVFNEPPVYTIVVVCTGNAKIVRCDELKHPDTQNNILQFGQRVMVDGALAYIVKHISSNNGEDIYCAAFPRAISGNTAEDYEEALRVISSADIHLLSPAFKELPRPGMPTSFGDKLVTGFMDVMALGPTFTGKNPVTGVSEPRAAAVTPEGKILVMPVYVGL